MRLEKLRSDRHRCLFAPSISRGARQAVCQNNRGANPTSARAFHHHRRLIWLQTQVPCQRDNASVEVTSPRVRNRLFRRRFGPRFACKGVLGRSQHWAGAVPLRLAVLMVHISRGLRGAARADVGGPVKSPRRLRVPKAPGHLDTRGMGPRRGNSAVVECPTATLVGQGPIDLTAAQGIAVARGQGPLPSPFKSNRGLASDTDLIGKG